MEGFGSPSFFVITDRFLVAYTRFSVCNLHFINGYNLLKFLLIFFCLLQKLFPNLQNGIV